MINMLWIFLAVVVVGIIFFYNTLVRAKQLVQEAWSGIDVQLKRRRDLIPNLVEVTKGYAGHEKTTLEEVTRLRSVDAPPSQRQQKQAVENDLTKALRSVFALAEAYPNLKANEQFLNLHKSLVDIEDELQMARRYYNGTVRDYNIRIQSFPGNFIAGMFNFKREEFFEIEIVTDRENPAVHL